MKSACLNPPNRISDVVKSRLGDTFDYPVSLMSNPAFALLVFDFDAKKWLQSPLDSWTRGAASVGWRGVLPVDHIYEMGNTGAATCMVALLTSPIWQLLNQGQCDADPRIPANGKIHLGIVGRREWKRLCDSFGIPYCLDETDRTAFAVRNAQEAVGGKGMHGAYATPEGVERGRIAAARILTGEAFATSTSNQSTILQSVKAWIGCLKNAIRQSHD